MDTSLLFVTDGLSGMKDAISRVFPDSRHQSCWVHLARNVSQSVRVKDRHEVLSDLSHVYRSTNLSHAENELTVFVVKWKSRYPKMVQRFNDTSSLFTFLEFPSAIRSSIYTTNIIEGFNKHLKRYTKRKEQFPNEDSLIRFIHNQANQFNQKFLSRVHKGFSLALNELNEMFK